MTTEEILRLAATVVPILTAAIPAFASAIASKDRPRRQMQADAELLQHLPEGSKAYQSVLRLIAAGADQLLERRNYKMDVPMLAVALVGVIGLGYLGIWLWSLETWLGWLLLVPIAVLWLVLLFGVFESALKKDRDKESK